MLLVSHLIISLAFPETPSVQLSTMNDEGIVARFITCLKNFDVKEEWYKRVVKKSSVRLL